MFIAVATFVEHFFVPSCRKPYKTSNMEHFIRKSLNIYTCQFQLLLFHNQCVKQYEIL